jgi:hypothetical protein
MRRTAMKVKTSELQGAALDWAVAQCEYFPVRYGFDDNCPEYSTNWEQGGPIIEREKLGVWWATHYVDDDGVEYGNHWYCETGCTDENYDAQHIAEGPTPLVAAMRCYVASKLGDEVEVPDEIVS